MLKGHGGEIYAWARELGLDPWEIKDHSSNLSPLPPPEGLYELLKNSLPEIENLPEVDSLSLRERFAQEYPHLFPEEILPSSGTTEWIFALPRVLEPQRVLILGPTYSDYADAAKTSKVPVFFFMAREEEDFRPPLEELAQNLKEDDLVFICNPNNPTGSFISPEKISALARENPKSYFVIDESYADFLPGKTSLLDLGERLPNVVILRSFSKIFKIPGLRLGLAVAGERFVRLLWRHYLPWSVNRLAQIAGPWLLDQKEHVKKVQNFVQEERKLIFEGLKNVEGLKIFKGQVHFFLVKLSRKKSHEVWRELLLKYRILVRNASNFEGLNEYYLRFSLRTKEENQALLKALKEVIQ